MAHKIDIKHRNRIVINQNGQRLTKIKGAIDPTYKVATPDVGVPADAYRQQETRGKEKVEEKSKDVSLEKLSEEEQETLKSLMAKLNG
jgi:hypothetical protein